MLESVIPRVLAWVPVTWRRAIIGRPGNPSRAATFVHDLLNLRPPAASQVFTCRGALQGYRMSIDWNRFRSFVYGTWEPDVVNAVVSTVKAGATVIDIGAHIGYYTLLLAKCVGPAGRVISFEPLPVNLTLLRQNVQLNDLQHVQVKAQAVFSRNEELTITVPDHAPNSGEASVLPVEGAKQFRVPATTLDSFCSGTGCRPDFLKMDVEGAEYDVLLGAKETIAQSRPKMLIELHHFDGNLARHPVPELLVSWDYEIQWIDRSHMTSHILALPKTSSSLDSANTIHQGPLNEPSANSDQKARS
jgi:FkbM family methyltransferase